MTLPIQDRIKKAFDDYRGSTALLEQFARNRENPQELVILICSRLDALANLAMTQKKSQRERFVAFLHEYSGKAPTLRQVALPNLYFSLSVQFSVLQYLLPSPGRLRTYDLARDAVFLKFIVDSGIALTSQEVTQFMHRLSVWLQKRYRTTATQSKTKPDRDSAAGVAEHLRACSASYRNGRYDQAVSSIGPLLSAYRLGDILYRDYRSSSIHEFTFDTDKRFFREPAIYAPTRYHAFDSTRYLEVCFSARWLLDLYRQSIDNYERALLARQKLPIDLWTELCDASTEAHLLDNSTVPIAKDLTIRVER